MDLDSRWGSLLETFDPTHLRTGWALNPRLEPKAGSRRVPVDVTGKIAYASSNPRPSPGVSAVPWALPSSIAFTEGPVGVSTRRPAMAGKPLVLSLILCVSAIGARAATREEIVPAGTILHCTMDEQNFSSKTAQLGDPVLCHLGPLNTFGHSVFPRGAMLSGHLAESKDPGHLVGKGWLQLEFDRIILPGAEVMPLAAKIIAAPHLKTDKEGKLHGGGHPTRDAVEWMIPVLWPIKILTLPARGPYPALKGESRLTMRLMEDVIVPLPAARAAVPSPPWAMPTSYIPSPYGLMRPASMTTREPAPEIRTVADTGTPLPGGAL